MSLPAGVELLLHLMGLFLYDKAVPVDGISTVHIHPVELFL
jgi:hypothetical protein